MFSFVKKYAESIDGVQFYPIVGLIIFLSFFALLLVWLFKADKKYIQELENLPFNQDTNN